MTDRDLIELIDQAHREPIPPVPLQAIRDQGAMETKSRRITALAGIAAAIVFIAAGGGWVTAKLNQSAPPPAAPPTRVVGWIDAPALDYARAMAQIVDARHARPCGANDLDLSVGQSDGGTGQVTTEVLIRNTSDSACLVTGFPQAVVASEPGKPEVTAAPQRSVNESEIAIAPGAQSTLTLSTATICEAHPGGGGRPDLYHQVDIAFNGDLASGDLAGHTFTLEFEQGLDLKCGLGTSQVLNDWTNLPNQPGPDDPIRRIALSLDTSDFAPGGESRFLVKVVNPTSVPVRFLPCPSYSGKVSGSAGPIAGFAQRLNCSGSGPIDPGDSRLFEIRVPSWKVTPKPGERLTVTWQLNLGALKLAAEPSQVIVPG